MKTKEINKEYPIGKEIQASYCRGNHRMNVSIHSEWIWDSLSDLGYIALGITNDGEIVMIEEYDLKFQLAEGFENENEIKEAFFNIKNR